MYSICKVIHVLVLGLWFGSVVFFTIAGVLIFRGFEEATHDRPDQGFWLPAPPPQQTNHLGDTFTVDKEQGSRMAGIAVSGIFPVYYALQTTCGLLACLTLLGLRGGKWTWVVALAALVSVLAGWWLEQRVSELRKPRNTLTDELLRTKEPTSEQIEKAKEARAAFGRWHGFSLMQNFATLALTTVALALAARLPDKPAG